MSVAAVALARTETYDIDVVAQSLRALAVRLGWGTAERPLGRLIKDGDCVVLKPNWVLHANRVQHGLDPLVTHPHVVQATAELALESGAAQVLVGDAPLQSCDVGRLWKATGLDTWAMALSQRDSRFVGLRDFRRTRSQYQDGVLVQAEDQVDLAQFVIVDLGVESSLEAVSEPGARFRVTQYDPRRMVSTHAAGRHQYLVARALLDADVVINLPKLKTHRKAGMTAALKNLVGINGNKEFLPHHRLGGAGAGGDCYPGRSLVKRTHEWLLDFQNSLRSHALRRLVNLPARACSLTARLWVDELGVEGAWSGNDTVWRMCLDLNTVLAFARPDGSIADVPQRKVAHIVDAVIGGQGDGPLAAEPYPLGLLLASENAAAADLVGAGLLGYDWQAIPIVREAFRHTRLAPVHGLAADVCAVDVSTGEAVDLTRGWPVPSAYPLGWIDAVRPGLHSSPPVGRGATRIGPDA